jgi:hypothetical protein
MIPAWLQFAPASRSAAEALPSLGTGRFDFTARMRELCADMIGRTPELAHIDLSRVAISFCQARKRVQHGLFASLTPLRFRDGALTGRRRGRIYGVQRLYDGAGVEMLYVLSFYLPRFMDLDFREKLITVLHELWHISPRFDGDLRRHPGRCYAHTSSQAEYDAHMGVLADRWLADGPPQALYGFLRGDFNELQRQHGSIVGIRIPRPKQILQR